MATCKTRFSEVPLLHAQTLASREKVLVCARCARSAASFSDQLDLCTGATRRRRLIRAAGAAPETGCTHWCPNGCGEAWCCADCRAADATGHLLLCPGSDRSGGDEAMSSFWSYARRAGETLLLGGQAVAQAIGRTLERANSQLEPGSASSAARTHEEALLEAQRLWETCGRLNHHRGGESGGEGGGEFDGVVGGGLSEAAEEQASEAWGLLRVAIGLRLPDDHVAALQPLLALDLCAPALADALDSCGTLRGLLMPNRTSSH